MPPAACAGRAPVRGGASPKIPSGSNGVLEEQVEGVVARSNLELLSRAQAQLFEDANIGVLGTLRKDGTSHLTPVWVSLDGDVIVINTCSDRLKYRHIQRDPRVSVVVIDKNDSTRYVSVTGIAELTEEGAEEHMYALGRKYVTEPAQLETYNEVARTTADIRALVRVTPTHITHWNVN